MAKHFSTLLSCTLVLILLISLHATTAGPKDTHWLQRRGSEASSVLSEADISAHIQDENRKLIEQVELTSAIFGNTRTLRVILPPDYYKPENLQQRYAVLYFNDGFAVFKPTGWNAPQTIYRQMREDAIPPVIVVGIDNAATIENGMVAALYTVMNKPNVFGLLLKEK